ncbi:unnamed protein product [Schistosoma mattheei]|uniref:Uncharacterized protein n=1 Tax=Schistosoma mattheei TaxID=31246 RepID=A0A183NMB8_9TREM|nr:unnamed protein product [Schistosoma mattheei]
MQSYAPPDVRQVKLDAFSCHGSNVSFVSRHSKISSRITLAELKERQLSEIRDLIDLIDRGNNYCAFRESSGR